METNKQTDEITGTPLSGELAETTSQRESVENYSERENNDVSELENNDFETSSKGEKTIISSKREASGNFSSMRKKMNEWIKTNPLTSLFIAVIAGLVVFVIPKVIVYYRCYTRPYITFESDFTQVFCLSYGFFLDLDIEYSVGEKKWKKYNKDQYIVFGGNLGKLLLRGRNERGTYDSNISFATEAQVICTGDICTLIDYKQVSFKHNHTDTKNAKFSRLFEGCTQLVVAPLLSPKVLNDGCYQSMFSGCTSLKTAPKLPATELAEYCYLGMFCGCTSLIIAPELPAKDLADNCYFSMFSGCTSLSFAPELPAKDLANGCYCNMFRDCISLGFGPLLPATKLAEYCYEDMFRGCTSLVTAQQLPATELAKDCYNSMFRDCTSLKRAPKLRAIELVNKCYYCMFSGCTTLSDITMQAIDIDASNCLTDWLENTSPVGIFYKNKNATWENEGIVPPGWEVVLVDQ